MNRTTNKNKPVHTNNLFPAVNNPANNEHMLKFCITNNMGTSMIGSKFVVPWEENEGYCNIRAIKLRLYGNCLAVSGTMLQGVGMLPFIWRHLHNTSGDSTMVSDEFNM
jgi:hypothetical protein